MVTIAKEQTAERAAGMWGKVLRKSMSKGKKKSKGKKTDTKMPTQQMLEEFCEDFEKKLLSKEPYCISCTGSPDPIFYGLKWFKELRRFLPRKMFMLIRWDTGSIVMQKPNSVSSQR